VSAVKDWIFGGLDMKWFMLTIFADLRKKINGKGGIPTKLSFYESQR
tara:strand:+ start:586 stop:726 length:141 start_codon:yes stop_codon:yes gene_type:complete